MVRACAGKDLPKGDPAKTYLLRTVGNQAHEVLDVTDPGNPTFVSTVIADLTSTHKNWWECDTGIAYIVAYTTWKVSCNPLNFRKQFAEGFFRAVFISP
jgi:hypothetical protein